MRILFVCGSLEPGRDGVGDYARLLGKSLAHSGNEVMLLSINDSYQTPARKLLIEGTRIKILRISSDWNLNTRCSIAQYGIDIFRPEWVSLQYVPYSFHEKGLELRLPRFFAALRGNYQWHLMIHEPWVSGGGFLSKNQFIGIVQHKLLRLLIKKLNPAMIHTSNPYYQSILEKGGVKSELLHLPSNIPLPAEEANLLDEEFRALGLGEESRAEWMVLGTFGRLRPGIDYQKLLQQVMEFPEASGKRIAFLSIGNAGPFSHQIFEDIRSTFGNRVLLHKFGYKAIAEVSSFFRSLDFGVASVPHYLLGKSGAYAAMRIHRLKILVPEPSEQNEMKSLDGNSSSFLHKFSDEDFSSERVAQAMISSLNRAVTSI